MQLTFIALAAFLGSMAVALLGWFESNEPFSIRKFGASLIRGIIGAGIIAIATSNFTDIKPGDFLIAFLAGAGIDAGGKRLVASLSALYNRK